MPKRVALFDQRPIVDWIDDLQHAAGAEDRYRALLAIQSLESAASVMGWNRTALRDVDQGVRALAAKQLGEMRRSPANEVGASVWNDVTTELLGVLDDSDLDVRFEAARALGRIDPQNARAKETLLSLLDDDQTQPLMIAILISALTELDNNDRNFMIPRLRELISHEQAEVREAVSAAMVQLGSKTEQLIPELIAALEDDEPIVRENAAIALGLSRSALVEVQTALQAAESDEDEGVANAARDARAILSKQ